MQAIQTKYFAPGNVRGARIKATAAAGSITVPYDHRLNTEQNHEAAARAFQAKLGWNHENYGHLVGGTLADGTYVFVMTGRSFACAACGEPLDALR